MIRNVVFAINSLGGGGAESHTLRVMNHLDRSKWCPILAVTRSGGNYEQFLRDDIPVETIAAVRRSNGTRILTSPLSMIPLVFRHEPAIVFLVMDALAVLGIPALLSLGKRRPKIVPIVQAPPSISQQATRFGRVVVLPGIRHLFHHADRVIALSHGVRSDLVALDPRIEAVSTVIHNACVDERIEAPPDVELPRTNAPVVLAAGRLHPQKDYPTMLNAFAKVHRATGAELWILGEGAERSAVEAQIARLELGSAVRLLGFQRDPAAFMRRANVFCLSSYYEGFGNVIVEAMASGAPVVSTACPHGPSEIITDGQTGLLVPVRDSEALSQALIRILRDDPLRARIAAAGKARSMDFHAKTIASAYSDEMERIVAGAARPTSAAAAVPAAERS